MSRVERDGTKLRLVWKAAYEKHIDMKNLGIGCRARNT